MPKKNAPMVFVIRKFSAPRAAVWNLWVTPENVQKWWGPKEFTSPKVELDFQKGGKYLLCMRGPGLDGKQMDYFNAGEITEVKPKEKIVWVMRFTDENGKSIEPKEIGLPGKWPKETKTTAVFSDVPGGTMLTVQEEGIPVEALSPATQGWVEQFEKMEEALTGTHPQKIATDLMFTGSVAGKAEEAMKLYSSLFKDSKITQLERYVPGDGDTVGWIKFGTFLLAGQTFHAMDSGIPHKFGFTPSVNLFVTCESETELDALYKVLSANGTVLMELGKYPFAQKYCWVNDRYGVSWQLFVPPKR